VPFCSHQYQIEYQICGQSAPEARIVLDIIWFRSGGVDVSLGTIIARHLPPNLMKKPKTILEQIWLRGTRLRSAMIITLSVAFLSGSAVAITITPISANRSLSVSVTAGSDTGSQSSSDSQSSMQFGGFIGNVAASAHWLVFDPPAIDLVTASAAASQNSSFSSVGFSDVSRLSYETGTSSVDLSSFVSAQATSFSRVSFSVPSKVKFDVLYTWESLLDFFSVTEFTTTLVSNTGGTIFDLSPDSGFGSISISGSLQPGQIYTLTFDQDIFSDEPDYLGRSAEWDTSLTMNISAVPEQGGLFCGVIGFGCVIAIHLLAPKWRQAQAH
jgi:hypothetical protein